MAEPNRGPGISPLQNSAGRLGSHRQRKQFRRETAAGGNHSPPFRDELKHYREPFLARAARKPVWRWPNELPIADEPADVAAMQMHYLAWLQKTEVPKLLIFAHPGAFTPEPIVAWAKANLPKLQSVDIGDGIHNLQEDHPAEIGQAIVSWMERFRQPQRTGLR